MDVSTPTPETHTDKVRERPNNPGQKHGKARNTKCMQSKPGGKHTNQAKAQGIPNNNQNIQEGKHPCHETQKHGLAFILPPIGSKTTARTVVTVHGRVMSLNTSSFYIPSTIVALLLALQLPPRPHSDPGGGGCGRAPP